MGKGGSSGGSATTQEIPAELKPLYTQTGEGIQEIQKQNPVSNYLGANPAAVAPLSGTQERSLGLLNTNLDQALTPLEQAPIVQAGHRYFENAIAPGIQNQAGLAGLGRSTAMTNALAATEAQTALPLLQGEQARRDQMIESGFRGGDIERSVQQQQFNAQQEDYLRRQALAEQGLFGPMSQLPSTFGQVTRTSSSGGGGMFKGFILPWLIAIVGAALWI